MTSPIQLQLSPLINILLKDRKNNLIQSLSLKKLQIVFHKIKLSSPITNKITNKPLQPCQKQRLSTTNQSREYRRRLSDGSNGSFSTTSPTSQCRPNLCKALCTQNTIIDNHWVVMKVHKYHRICYAAVDLGASCNFYSTDYTGKKNDPTANPICVGCAKKAVIVSLADDVIRFNSLPLAAKKCHKFKEILATSVICISTM